MNRFVFMTLVFVLAVFVETVHAATCDAGRYLKGNACTDCPVGYYCPGDDTQNLCPDGYTTRATKTETADDCVIQCPAGQYLSADNTECLICEIGYACSGNTLRTQCNGVGGNNGQSTYSDELGLTKCKQCPSPAAEYLDNWAGLWYWTGTGLADSMNKCYSKWNHTETHGSFQARCAYTTTGYTEPDYSNISKCIANTANKCDAGYWIDTSNPAISKFLSSLHFWTYSYDDIMNTEFCVPVGPGYYSPANNAERTPCPRGTYSNADTAVSCTACPENSTTASTGAKSIDDCKCFAGYGYHDGECVPLCGVGATKLRTDDTVFNMYENDVCDSPALRIGLPAGTCCVNLERGRGRLNVEYQGDVWHAID